MSWNKNFTVLLRKDRSSLWGNWALNAKIQPGAIGIVDSQTGEFTLTSDIIPDALIDETSLSQKWIVKSDDVKVSNSKIQLDGSVTDPDTGIKITAGVETTWSFQSVGSLCSSFAMTKESSLHDFPTLIKDHMEWLIKKASDVQMTNKDGIIQGFCIVTDVIYTKSGLNIGANSAKSSFSIQGSVSGVEKLTGDNLSGKGSYVSTHETSSMNKHLWPYSPGEVAKDEIPIAFAVASFDGKSFIPNWTQHLSSFDLFLQNNNGGTYIVDGTLKYDLEGKEYTSAIRRWGGGWGSINVPLHAKNLKFNITYVASDVKHSFSWENPIIEWPSHQRHIDIKGVWKKPPTATDRESSPDNK